MMVVLSFIKLVDNGVYVTDRSAVGNSLPETDSSHGGTDDLFNISGIVDGGNFLVKFSRSFTTGDKNV